MQVLETSEAVKRNWLEIDGSKELVISVRRRCGSNMPVPADIKIDAQNASALLGLLASNDFTPKEVSSKQVFSEMMVNGMMVGVVNPMVCALLYDDRASIIEFCSILRENGFKQVGDLVVSEWLKDDVAGIELSGHKHQVNKAA